MFYAITGTVIGLTIIGLVFTGIAAFRFLGGRDTDQELVVAHPVYWYAVAAAFQRSLADRVRDEMSERSERTGPASASERSGDGVRGRSPRAKTSGRPR